MKDEMIKFLKSYLKDNLTIEVNTRKDCDYSGDYNVIEVKILIDDTVISKSQDTISI